MINHYFSKCANCKHDLYIHNPKKIQNGKNVWHKGIEDICALTCMVKDCWCNKPEYEVTNDGSPPTFENVGIRA